MPPGRHRCFTLTPCFRRGRLYSLPSRERYRRKRSRGYSKVPSANNPRNSWSDMPNSSVHT